MAPLFLSLYNTGSWTVYFTSPPHLMWETKPRCLLWWNLWKVQPSWHSGEEKEISWLYRDSNRRPSTLCPNPHSYWVTPIAHRVVKISDYEQISGNFLRCVHVVAESGYLLRRVCPSVRQKGTTRIPLDRFSLNLLFEKIFFRKCQENWSFNKLKFQQIKVSTNWSFDKLNFQQIEVSTNWSCKNWSFNKLKFQQIEFEKKLNFKQIEVATNWIFNNLKLQKI